MTELPEDPRDAADQLIYRQIPLNMFYKNHSPSASYLGDMYLELIARSRDLSSLPQHEQDQLFPIIEKMWQTAMHREKIQSEEELSKSQRDRLETDIDLKESQNRLTKRATILTFVGTALTAVQVALILVQIAN